MVMMIDRSPEGRDTGEGLESAVQDKTTRELIVMLIAEVRMLRLAMVRRGTAIDLGDLSDLEADVPASWIEGD